MTAAEEALSGDVFELGFFADGVKSGIGGVVEIRFILLDDRLKLRKPLRKRESYIAARPVAGCAERSLFMRDGWTADGAEAVQLVLIAGRIVVGFGWLEFIFQRRVVDFDDRNGRF